MKKQEITKFLLEIIDDYGYRLNSGLNCEQVEDIKEFLREAGKQENPRCEEGEA